MPRANRTYLPGLIWHITHRCHDRRYLLQHTPQKQTWKKWLMESKQRYGLTVLDYTITDNHIHLLAYDGGKESVIAPSMQLTEGQTAQRYNLVNKRTGAFWSDRYHATAVETGDHLLKCLCYIDFNMVRAGAVSHPREWAWGGYCEIQGIRQRYCLVDTELLAWLVGAENPKDLQRIHSRMIDAQLSKGGLKRDDCWTSSVAVGSSEFVRSIHERLNERLVVKSTTDEEKEMSLVKELEAPYSVFKEKRASNLYRWALGDAPF
ncbi:transposase [Chitinispirillales bacterium ANBcel5]|uniref:transposase n=1 Tax=Cellulosispirillum alkaliphilum TaxID=3039283 RepID=UPI002A508CCC|nr:transposase [Chitinispirillales bacterium ANBcel5]